MVFVEAAKGRRHNVCVDWNLRHLGDMPGVFSLRLPSVMCGSIL